MTKTLVLAGFLALMPVSVLAEQAPASPQANARFGALRQAGSQDPYSKLFQAQQALNEAIQARSRGSSAQPRVVCGMTIIPVGPEIDPKMAVTPPKDPKVKYTIRAIDPPICNSSRR